MADVAIVGGGVIGCACAAFLAEAGASVRLYERDVLGAGASGRNSGVLEHPLDEALEPLFARSLEHYAALGGFPFGPEPVGCLVLGEDPAPLRAKAAELAPRFASLGFDWLDPADLAREEPGLAPGLSALRMATGRPVPPAAAVRAFADRARAAGAELLEGTGARPVHDGDRVAGVHTATGFEPAGAVVIAAGPWSGELGTALPVTALWGVVAQVRLASPPRHVLEEVGAESLVKTGPPETRLFSLITLDGTSSLGSSFEPAEPDPGRSRSSCAPAARASCRRSRTPSSGRCGAARGRSRTTAARCSGPFPGSPGCTSRPATGRGASRSGRPPRSWSRRPCSTRRVRSRQN